MSAQSARLRPSDAASFPFCHWAAMAQLTDQGRVAVAIQDPFGKSNRLARRSVQPPGTPYHSIPNFRSSTAMPAAITAITGSSPTRIWVAFCTQAKLKYQPKRKAPMATKCAHCGSPAYTRTSRMLSLVSQEEYFQCSDISCGHTFRAVREHIETLSPSAMPNPAVTLPQASRTRLAAMRIAQRMINDKEQLAISFDS